MKQKGYEKLISNYVNSKLGNDVMVGRIDTRYGSATVYYNNNKHVIVFDNYTKLTIYEINRQGLAVFFTDELVYKSGKKLLVFETHHFLKGEVSYLLKHLKQLEVKNDNLSHT